MLINNKTKGRKMCLHTMKKGLLTTNQYVFSIIALTKFYLVVFLPYVSVVCIKFKGDFMLVSEGWYLILSFNSK